MYFQRKLAKHQRNIKSLDMMDIICIAEGAAEPKLSDLGYILQEILMGMQCSLMLAE